MAETREGWAKYCCRQLPRNVCGNLRHVWTVDGRWKLGNYEEKKEKNCPKWQKPGRGGRDISSFGYRQIPRASVAVRAICGQKAGDGRCEIMRKTEKSGLNGRHQGGVSEILHPSASASFRQLPRTSVDIRGMCARKLEDGRWGIMKKNKGKSA